MNNKNIANVMKIVLTLKDSGETVIKISQGDKNDEVALKDIETDFIRYVNKTHSKNIRGK